MDSGAAGGLYPPAVSRAGRAAGTSPESLRSSERVLFTFAKTA